MNLGRFAVWAFAVLAAGCSYDPIPESPAPFDGGPDAATDGGRDEPVIDAAKDGGLDGGPGALLDDGGPADGGDAGDRDASDGHVDDEEDVDDDGGVDVDPQTWPDGILVEPLVPGVTGFNEWRAAGDPNSPCSMTPPTSRGDCEHISLSRVLPLPDETSCAGLTAEDEQGWFDWKCHPVGSGFAFESFALPFRLANLINAAKLEWRENRVTVRRGSTIVLQTESQAFWDNPVLEVPASAGPGTTELDVEGAVYVVVNEASTRDLVITADRVSMFMDDDVRLPSRASTGPYLSADGRAFAWLEDLRFDAGQRANGVDLDLVRSHVRGIEVTRDSTGPSAGVDLRIRAESSEIRELASIEAAAVALRLEGRDIDGNGYLVSDPGSHGVELLLSDSTLKELLSLRAGGAGIRMLDLSGTDVSEVNVGSAQSHGLWLAGVSDSRVQRVTVADCAGDGVLVEASGTTAEASVDDTLLDVVTTNNAQSGLRLLGDNHRAVLVLAASNGNHGVEVGGKRALVQHVTAVNNLGAGVYVGASAVGASLVDVLSANDAIGLQLDAGSSGTRVHDLHAAQNDTELQVLGASNVFSGVLQLGASDGCEVTGSPTDPGLDAGPPCAIALPSTATLSAPYSIASALVGRLTADDPVNPEVVDAQGGLPHDMIDDWLFFSARQRYFGKYSALSFPASAQRGRCGIGATCAVWDARVQAESSLSDVLGEPPLDALDDAVHVLSHDWDADSELSCASVVVGATWDEPSCRSSFLAYAYEPIDGTSGNENALCEPGEACVLNRNRGAYPGEGTLGPFEGGAVLVPSFGMVNLSRYPTNAP